MKSAVDSMCFWDV